MTSITNAYVTHYSDNGQTMAHVEWADGAHTTGQARKAGKPCACCGAELQADWNGYHLGAHMAALFTRARRDGIDIKVQRW